MDYADCHCCLKIELIAVNPMLSDVLGKKYFESLLRQSSLSIDVTVESS